MTKVLTGLCCLWFSSIEKCFKEESNFSEAVTFIRPEISKFPKSNSKVLPGAFSFGKKNKLGISSLLKTTCNIQLHWVVWVFFFPCSKMWYSLPQLSELIMVVVYLFWLKQDSGSRKEHVALGNQVDLFICVWELHFLLDLKYNCRVLWAQTSHIYCFSFQCWIKT